MVDYSADYKARRTAILSAYPEAFLRDEKGDDVDLTDLVAQANAGADLSVADCMFLCSHLDLGHLAWVVMDGQGAETVVGKATAE